MNQHCIIQYVRKYATAKVFTHWLDDADARREVLAYLRDQIGHMRSLKTPSTRYWISITLEAEEQHPAAARLLTLVRQALRARKEDCHCDVYHCDDVIYAAGGRGPETYVAHIYVSVINRSKEKGTCAM